MSDGEQTTETATPAPQEAPAVTPAEQGRPGAEPAREGDPRATPEGEHESAAAPGTPEVVDVEGPEHAAAVEELDPETRERRDAALSLVRKFGDPVLRATAVPVQRFDEQLRTEAARMGELMHDALGVGLAATQVGILHRLLVYKAYEEDP